MPWIKVNSEPPKPTTFEDLGYVQVVRCKDCRWGEPTKNAFGEDSIICGNDDTYIDRYITIPPDWFCADGERRDS